jgi:hypothetical protein
MRFLMRPTLFVGLIFIVSSCAGFTQASKNSGPTSIAPTATTNPDLFACRSVKSALVGVIQTLSDYTKQGATDLEAITAMGELADALNLAAESLSGYSETVFRQTALSVNQLRVAKINGSTPNQSVWDATEQNFTNIETLCSFD